jgi:hypothetical protein
MTKFASLRDYLPGLDRLGDLQHVMQKIDWNLEAAAGQLNLALASQIRCHVAAA